MFKKAIATSIFTALFIALPLTASAAQLLCSSSIQFDPEEITLNREDPQLVPVLMTYMAEENFEMCNYELNLYDPDGNPTGKDVKIESIIDLTSGNFNINFNKNDFLEKEMSKDGTYTLEFTKNNDKTPTAVLYFNLTSGQVLGVFHERGGLNTFLILAAIIIMAGGVGVYVARQKQLF